MRWVFSPFYRGGNRVLESGNNVFKIPNQHMDQLGAVEPTQVWLCSFFSLHYSTLTLRGKQGKQTPSY